MKRLVPVFAVVLLLGCASHPTPGISPLASSSSSPLAAAESPIATPTQAAAEYVIPTPVDGGAVVTGLLAVENSNEMMAGVKLYLGDHIGSTDDTPLYGFDPSVAPAAVVDEYGRFLFTDVPPGRYVMIVWNSATPVLAEDPSSGLPLDITLESGQVLDLGLLSEPMP